MTRRGNKGIVMLDWIRSIERLPKTVLISLMLGIVALSAILNVTA